MKLDEIKVGGRYRVADGGVFCRNVDAKIGDVVEIEKVVSGGLYYRNTRNNWSCFTCIKPEHLAPLSDNPLDNLAEGDVVVDEEKDERTVLYVLKPGLYIMSEWNEPKSAGYAVTAHDLANCTIKGAPAEPKELTVAEISEKLGYEVKVVKERSEHGEE